MLVIWGGEALSAFRLARVSSSAKNIVPEISSLAARWVYFVDCEQSLSPAELTTLHQLIAVSSEESPAWEIDYRVVTPRLGTISPWSSKATNILHDCGLTGVKRLERGLCYQAEQLSDLPSDRLSGRQWSALSAVLHDRMTESVLSDVSEAEAIFKVTPPESLVTVPVMTQGRDALVEINTSLGLALSDDEIDYLLVNYQQMKRDPSDAELMMFAQANSEHCRHKIFNADWTIDGDKKEISLFNMIRNTHALAPEHVLSAYHDNAAVIEGNPGQRLMIDPQTAEFKETLEPCHIQIKVETHNHPTAISPFAGAATGSGGEIRDEGATGIGGRPKAGLCGFTVSGLNIPNFRQPWELDYGKPARIVNALDIMIEGPIGAAAFNNEFGRPNLTGYFRSYEQLTPALNGVQVRGYHKPIMIAGGLGNMRPTQIDKRSVAPGDAIVVLGGPAMLIGLGGGAASSMASGQSSENLDFASVQRDNPEMEHRCQEVLNACIALGEDSPVRSLHDVGAGGLSNAVPELINDAGLGGQFELRAIPNDEPGMSPMAVWCNESQERYVLAIADNQLNVFEAMCERERCPYAVLGQATEARDLKVKDSHFDNHTVDMPLSVLLGKPPKMHRDVKSQKTCGNAIDTSSVDLSEACLSVLRHPTVASKNFLITIGDRTVGGLTHRDQMVGPWQMPVADVAVTLNDFRGVAGEAMAMGERTPVAVLDAPASGRLAIGEALTNLCAAPIPDLSYVALSANWMAAAGHAGEDAALFETVKAVGMELCPALGLSIPVGKDSLSMKTVWRDEAEEKSVVSPLSLIITAFAPIENVEGTLTPQLKTGVDDRLVLIDLGTGKDRLGGSIFAQTQQRVGQSTPDVDDPLLLKGFVAAMQQIHQQKLAYAYHDRSDGGLWAALCEMAFAANTGLAIHTDNLSVDAVSALFNEELGAVIQINASDLATVESLFALHGLSDCVSVVGQVSDDQNITLKAAGLDLFSASMASLRTEWWQVSSHIQRLRDNPVAAEQELALISDASDPGISPVTTFDIQEDVAAPYLNLGAKPKVAILREQGVNGQQEMAAAFMQVGFEAIDVHMSDLHTGRVNLEGMVGLAACGGFSYGDVLGAGGGWAGSILHNAKLRDDFSAFFQRSDSFGLGVCNGCQMLSRLKDLIPGAEHWPSFERNDSEQYEARLSMVKVEKSPSILLQGMEGSELPVVVAHGEGRASFGSEVSKDQAFSALRYVNNRGEYAVAYPHNPNGSEASVASVTSSDGRFTAMMPHPERIFRRLQHSYAPSQWQGHDGPWLRLFRNARVWVD